MSEQNTRKIEDTIIEHLDGELKEIALKFATYLNENQLTPKLWRANYWKIPYKEYNICMMQFELGEWKITFFFSDYDGEFDKSFITTIQEHVKICTSCHDGCTSGIDATIFGKEYLNTCSQLTIQFTNPNINALEHIKKLIEYSEKLPPHSESWHAHN